ncbi:MAG: FecR family protein, partial [Zoogloeaceae bacterium]|nr:FecR family protein [Zoogloeaceae bacterium]
MKTVEKGIFRFWGWGAALVFLLCAVQVSAQTGAGQEIGKVISFTPGASVVRNGKAEALALHAGVRVSDTIRTDAGGRVKILFNDDSAVSVGPNTSMDMREYSESGAKPAFGLNVTQGVVRAFTGKITERNPEGFKMTTPEAVVGIRGTIISLRTGDGATTVYVENTLRNVFVNNTNVPSGNKMMVSEGGMRMERITPQDRQGLGRDLAFLGGSGSAAAAPEPGAEGGQPVATEQLVASAGNALSSENPLQDIPVAVQTLGDSQLGTQPVARVEGSLTSTGRFNSGVLSMEHGEFSFNVNLASGKITDASMSGWAKATAHSPNVTWENESFNASGGSGIFVSGSGASISGFSGVAGYITPTGDSPVHFSILPSTRWEERR